MDADQIRRLMEDQLRHSRRLQARIQELEEERRAPLAVVGMALRLPGGLDSPEGYWDFLRGEGTAYGPIPEDRPGLRAVYDPVVGKPGRSYADQAGFLDDIAHFDADFFGISQREAKLLDPQQRMLLETAWEALERAGIPVRRPDRLNVGVYLGMMASEYLERLEDRSDTSGIDPYFTTGGGLCFGAGRISHTMGFSGPVLSVDTACSSSLTALHLAARGLRAKECRYALLCGSNLLLSANLMVSLSQTRALSPTCRSHSFLASADGYGRGEGVGVLVLMRLADAEAEGRPILAVLRGTAVNHDGAASGLTAPNGPAQQEVIRAALDDAGVDPAEIGWIEAHGTGTALGDPIEVGALDGVIGDAVRARGFPLPIGSVKSRLGHLEAASGIAALIKAVLMLRHGEIPAAASPDDGPLNPHIPWDTLGFTVPRANQPWPEQLPRRIAGVNSFGMSGTNAHALLEAYDTGAAAADAPAGPGAVDGGPELLTVSAKDPVALGILAGRLADRLRKGDPAQAPSLCHTQRCGRAAHPVRLAVTATSAAALADELDAAVEGLAHTAAPRADRTPRDLTLLPGGDEAALTAALRELVRAYPALQGDQSQPPAAGLAALLGRFGLRVGLGAAGAGPARLTWQSAGRPHTAPLTGERPQDAQGLLLAALAALFTAGAEPRLDALRAPGAELLGDLPTYPFQRRRFWIDEPAMFGAGAQQGGDGGGAAAGEAAPDPLDTAAVEAFLLRQLQDVLHADEPLDPELSFLDGGGDSFISTLFITRVEEHYRFGLTAEELPLDLPLTELLGSLARDITATAQAEREGAGRSGAEHAGAA
ncbi:type I polyketide synthase [Actinacidiphila epipremni]|jgi:acyl transferase domain-containing protein|uniref:Beta-ketoacyl synthase n=1 Tax=Actinacidiphila epipremni TaxID=2053013 RepID=A0ABX0ZPV6_9ACTN|nr:type I polyketide synthase [Actinacidiphila epipremni]NJP45291.1 beta-ketoacyl synthase [Actinacidiphila epipremni]